jgi:hypothetical protein
MKREMERPKKRNGLEVTRNRKMANPKANKKPSNSKYHPSSISFPPSWLWLVDEAIPTYVKTHFSPRESWKSKPFEKEDARFFFKGIEELSDLFTEDRPKGMPAYFQHPKFRSAYLLYFLPLQASKFLSLIQLHMDAFRAALDHAHKSKVLRVADLGAGPGTASISLLLSLLDPKIYPEKELPPIEFHWFDTNETIMKDGKALVEQLANNFPKLRGKVKVHLHPTVWWKAPSEITQEVSLTFIGHILNESKAPQREAQLFWEGIIQKTQGGGILLVEPAARRSAQLISTLRDDFFELNLIEKSPARIWGPCLHAEKCPLADGRDWCHFSFPVQIPGKWFKQFSEALGSERLWVKLSYLWLASESHPASVPDPKLRRVISDPLSQGPKSSVLICEPETPSRWPVPPRQSVGRGDLIRK